MEFVHRLQESIEKHANLNAFFINNTHYTYGQFGQAISNIRHQIQTKIDSSEKLIGLVTNDDLETYASIIALWLEGKAYVPINPIYPIERNIQILNLTDTTYLLNSSEKKEYSNYFSVLASNKLNNVSLNLIPKKIIPEDLAYILFTSGSTGTPKGVPITFKNLNSLVKALDEDIPFNLKPTDRCLQMFELTFDFSLVTYLPPLLFGACVYTIPKNTIKYFYIFKLIVKQKLTVLTMVPAIIHYLRPYFKEINSTTVRYCSFGGGKLHADIAQEWSECIPNCQIFNYYGPTEFTVYSGYYPYNKLNNTKHNNGIVSIGKPLYGVDYLIINDKKEETPVGVSGELCLAGDQLTPGYWKDAEKNKMSFFNKTEDGELKRYYKTGDLCYLDEEGDYMYVGRADFQVKIRGYRVELGEIEYHTKEIIRKIEIVALDVTNKLGNTELALVFVSDKFDLTHVLEYLKEKLPAYMIPSKFKFLKELPHSINDKVDRNKLRLYFKE